MIIVLAILVSIASYVVYRELYAEPQLRNKLLKFGRYTIAIIDDVNSIRRSSRQIPTYTFKVNEQSISSRKKGIIQKELFPFSKKSIGTKRYIIYLSENPNLNSILPYCIPPDSIEVPTNGWKELPTGSIEFIIP